MWEGGAHTELQVALVARGPETTRTSEDTIQLIRQLAAHHPDHQIAAILNKQGRLSGTGLTFTEPRVKRVRKQHRIPAAPPPDPGSGIFSIAQAASELGVNNITIHRWLREGLLPASRPPRTPPGGSASPRRSAPDSSPEVPDGLPPARPGRQTPRDRAPDRFAQGPTRRASRHPGHRRATKGPAYQATEHPLLDYLTNDGTRRAL